MKKAFPKNNFELGFSVQKQLFGREVYNFPDFFFKFVVFFYNHLKSSKNITKRPTWKQIIRFKSRILYKIKIHDHGLSPLLFKKYFVHIFFYLLTDFHNFAGPMATNGGGLMQWLGRRISDQGVPGSSPGRAPFVVALSKSHLPPA